MEVNNSLPTGALLKGLSYIYRIEKTLGQGSFGITYLASIEIKGSLGTINSSTVVAIKEFFMKDINGREKTVVTCGSKGGLYEDYKRKFIREAKILSKLDHPNIVKVLESFETNNTAYYVMEYIDGGNLNEYIEQHNGLPEAESLKYFKEIASALSYMHSHKMLHLDLKPSNIMLRDGSVVLIDFGLSKQYDENGIAESSTTIGGGTPGYAPIEQAHNHTGKDFPVTMDIYALGATLFKMLTCIRPPEASIILNDGFPLYELERKQISKKTISCIEKAMNPFKKGRYQNIGELITVFEDDDKVCQFEDTRIDDFYEGNLAVPDAGINIELYNPTPGSISYKFSLNSDICNTVQVYRDNKIILQDNWYGGIPEDVIHYLANNKFFNKRHWERETVTVKPGDGISVRCSFSYLNGETFSRSVKIARYGEHELLLCAIERLVRETCLQKWINKAIGNDQNEDEILTIPTQNKGTNTKKSQNTTTSEKNGFYNLLAMIWTLFFATLPFTGWIINFIIFPYVTQVVVVGIGVLIISVLSLYSTVKFYEGEKALMIINGPMHVIFTIAAIVSLWRFFEQFLNNY